ncbi:MAG: SPW repeat protein [Planctomycetaceae bacterium]|nr:SPW repeat protein [Planctomycetaceae bacterium]
MWSRVVEVVLGCWLLMSPFLFHHAGDETGLWVNDLTSGCAVILFGILSYWYPARHAHLLSLLVGGWLMVFAYFAGFGDTPAASQNHLIVGLLILMFAIIPNDADRPPSDWDEALGDDRS